MTQNLGGWKHTLLAKKAILLLSGGLDSSTVLAIANKEGYQIFALSIDYGQSNTHELQCADKLAKHFGILEHKKISIDLSAFGGSSLTTDIEVEKGRSFNEIGQGIPATYVPARNTLMLSYALAWAEVLEVCDIFIGVNAVDSSGYPDCRPEFIASFEAMANLATKLSTQGKRRILIHRPLQHLNKKEIIELGLELGLDYQLTSSCYDPDASSLACGQCDACRLRQRGFFDAGTKDPISYKSPLLPTALESSSTTTEMP